MANIAEWIEEIAGDEPVISAVLGLHDNLRFIAEPAPHAVGTVMPWSEARPILDYEYDNGHGGANCHPVFAWTETKIITVTEYDGATGPTWFPRSPIDVTPGFGGVS